jgi:putative FmdB family regulatory protein
MPFYEYECTKCHHQTEVFQKITDPPMAKCQVCGGKMKRLISHSSFHLKGAGWYVTDYTSKTGAHKAQTGAGGGDGSKKGPDKEAKKPGETKNKKENSVTETK